MPLRRCRLTAKSAISPRRFCVRFLLENPKFMNTAATFLPIEWLVGAGLLGWLLFIVVGVVCWRSRGNFSSAEQSLTIQLVRKEAERHRLQRQELSLWQQVSSLQRQRDSYMRRVLLLEETLARQNLSHGRELRAAISSAKRANTETAVATK